MTTTVEPAGAMNSTGPAADDGRVDAADEALAQQLAERAQAEGMSLTGPGGLLGRLTKVVLESALEGEMDAHLGYARRGTAAGTGLSLCSPLGVQDLFPSRGRLEPAAPALPLLCPLKNILPARAGRLRSRPMTPACLPAPGDTTNQDPGAGDLTKGARHGPDHRPLRPHHLREARLRQHHHPGPSPATSTAAARSARPASVPSRRTTSASFRSDPRRHGAHRVSAARR